MKLATSFLAGIIFGVGLVVSGMTNPQKVLNFLDVAGRFDPSLAFVMGGAVVTTLIGYKLVLPLGKPLLGDRFQLPTKSELDTPLIAGSALFGIGWGLGGYCPGPALTSLSFGMTATFVFVVAMMIGMWAGRQVLSRSVPTKPFPSKA